MEDMNGHIGIIGNRINRNRDKLLHFADMYSLDIINHNISEGKVSWKGRPVCI